MLVGFVQPTGVDIADVGVRTDVVGGQILGDDMTEPVIPHALLVQRHTSFVSVLGNRLIREQ